MKKPKLLLDSCLPRAVALRLRADGWDAATVADSGADPGDASVLARAVSEGRVLVTIDADFGALVFRDGAKHAGVLRLREARSAELADRAGVLVHAHAEQLAQGAFVTDDGDHVRVTVP